MGSITHKKGRNWLDKWPYLYPESNEPTFASVYDCGLSMLDVSVRLCLCRGNWYTHYVVLSPKRNAAFYMFTLLTGQKSSLGHI
jgi:hypothetical protein